MERSTTASVGFTPAQVHALTGVPPPTLARWEKEFREYLQVARTAGGHKRYAPDTINRIEKLREMILDHGLSLSGAKRQLERVDPVSSPDEMKEAIRKVASDWSAGRTDKLDLLAERMAEHLLRQAALAATDQVG